MKKIILVRYGEIILKGLNRPVFEDKLIANIKKSLVGFGKAAVIKSQARIFVEPENDNFEFDDEAMEEIGLKLSFIPVTKIMTPVQIRSLQKVDQRTYTSGMMGAVKKGIYKP